MRTVDQSCGAAGYVECEDGSGGAGAEGDGGGLTRDTGSH